MADKLDNVDNENVDNEIENSPLQSAVLSYKRSKKLLKCALSAICILLGLLTVFITVGWGSYNQGLSGDGELPPSDGSFTVLLNPKEGNKSIAVSETRGFANPTSNLKTNGINDAWNITLSDIPVSDIDTESGGAKNGDNYFAFTFFFKNTGTETLDYTERLTLTENRKDAVKALRIMICRDGESVIYASPAVNGDKEAFACDESFTGEEDLISKTVSGLEAGEVVRYTVIVWFEGNDPECIDDIRGGAVELSLAFEIV